MKTHTKRFSTTLFKEVIITKNPETDLFDLRVAFFKSNAVTLFEGSAKAYQINHLSHEKAIPVIVFYAESDPEKTKLIIKGKFQIRTYISHDKIRKFVIEKDGARHKPTTVFDLRFERS